MGMFSAKIEALVE